jgi:hypothetical protein
MKVMEQVLRLIDKVRIIDRIVLIIAIVSVAISCLLALVFGDGAFNLHNEIISTFIWFSILGCFWTCLLSTVALIISIIIHRLNNKEILRSFKQEIILTLVAAASLTMFYLCILAIK